MKRAVTLNGLLLVFGLLISAVAQAALTLSVDRNPVALDESFTLTLSSDGSVDGEPDFSALGQQFDILNQQQSSSYQVINGDISSSISWTLTLLAKQSGRFEIAPIQLDAQQSNPLTLEVKPRAVIDPAAEGASGSEALFLQLEADQGPLYVQQQLLLTIKLFLAHDAGFSIGNGSTLSEPEVGVGEAVIKRLGKDRNYQARLNGKAYSVIERRYALYPQQSGQLTVNPIQFDGRMVAASNRARSLFDSMQQRARIKRISSDALVREVKAIPASYSGKHWLPARSVQLVEEWGQQQSAQQVVVGEPITRTLALLVDGLSSAQLPALNVTLPQGVKSYPDQPVLQETPSDQGISALRQEKIALVATTPGKLTLPAIEVSWWNTEAAREETARLAAREVMVLPAAGATEPPQPPVQPAAQPLAAVANVDQGPPLMTVVKESHWMKLSLVLAIGWLLTLLLWWRSARATPHPVVEAAADSESLKAVRNRLQQACHPSCAAEAKDALLQWAQLRWPQQRPASLGELASLVEGELGSAINSLSRTLYRDEGSDWRGGPLWQAFTRQQGGDSVVVEESSELAPLFRHQ